MAASACYCLECWEDLVSVVKFSWIGLGFTLEIDHDRVRH